MTPDSHIRLPAHTFPPFFLVSRFLFAALFLSVCDVINLTVSLLPLSFGKSDLLALLRVRRLGWILICLLNNTLSATVAKPEDLKEQSPLGNSKNLFNYM
jgi:hypothetical protein